MSRFWRFGVALPLASLAGACVAISLTGAVTPGLALCVGLVFAIVARVAAGIGRRQARSSAESAEAVAGPRRAANRIDIDIDAEPTWRRDRAA